METLSIVLLKFERKTALMKLIKFDFYNFFLQLFTLKSYTDYWTYNIQLDKIYNKSKLANIFHEIWKYLKKFIISKKKTIGNNYFAVLLF
jgi:hypothetical protein